MKQFAVYKKITCLLLFCIVAFYSFAAMVGKTTSEGDDNAINLKNIGKYSRGKAIPSLRLSQFQYTGSSELRLKRNGNNINMPSMVRLQNGNTTYVYRYKYQVKKPLFKQPVPPPIR